MVHPERSLGVVLFDLDGTLIDSVGDLGRAANVMRAARALEPLPLRAYRAHGGSGARGMLAQAFGVSPESAGYASMKAEFLDTYEGLMHDTTEAFDGIRAVLASLESQGRRWGIVTNKAARFAAPLVSRLALNAAVLVCGDTTPHVKPHPAPLLEAASRLGIHAGEALYVGDDERDMRAARAAGMLGAAAAWGYLGAESSPAAWGADFLLAEPADLLKHLRVP